ncbi:MAG: winged helix-turn-helix transcriptional regulator [Actinomycetota bacterium]
MFEALGLGQDEERIYDALLRTPRSSFRELSEELNLSTRDLNRGLAVLRDEGFVTETATRPRRFVPAPPDVATEVVVLKRQEELQAARLAAARLVERHRVSMERTGSRDLLEIVTGAIAITPRVLQFERSAREEILLIDRPPYRVTPDEVERETPILERGVRYRVIYTREALERPGRLEKIHRLIEAGEEARVLPDVPTKFLIIDRRVAVVPLNIREPGTDEVVIIHASFLLDALAMFFDTLWEKAVPLEGQADESESSAPYHEFLPMLAAGLKDETVGRALGWSPRTVARRVSELMEDLGAKTRFQAGWVAARTYESVDADRKD